ncbi:DUF2851 family protein [Poritiphilus flavus]|uniref:DUF2851 family protein n=1 Tax=Poritiphilus flavus TaxID=2697053 RepID=A0A6L9EBL9_9FLAO|nr:DUF2851 family protein [Poritiphilus flavus]NAS11799.1 DUF2851 family protein [Poritiphilus flavus]
MKEDFLQYIWEHKKLPQAPLLTTEGKTVIIKDYGKLNLLSGPDFLYARIEINGQLWVGNVELHIRSSYWYAHHHETDPAYDNVILHVVWEDDIAVHRRDSTPIPALELKGLIKGDLLERYQKLFSDFSIKFINCEKEIATTNDFLLRHWMERLYFERLEQRTKIIFDLLEKLKFDWETVCFIMLAKGFGQAINSKSFFQMAQALDYSVARKLQGDATQLESVFFGMTGMLEEELPDIYHTKLREQYAYHKRKFGLNALSVPRAEFFKLRPSNFPTIRLSQLADLYSRNGALFNALMKADTYEELHLLLSCSASSYWEEHYTFGKPSRKVVKKLSPAFIDLLIINAVLPLKFCFARCHNAENHEEIIALISSIRAENNNIQQHFKRLGLSFENAMESQAILQLYHKYCKENRCLKCAVGVKLLSGK